MQNVEFEGGLGSYRWCKVTGNVTIR